MKKLPTIKTSNLTLQEVIAILANLKKGCYHSFETTKIDSESGYYRITTSNGRLCSYENMKSTKEKRANGIAKKTSTNSSMVVVIEDVLYFNTNTNNYLLSVKTTRRNCKTSHTIYFDNNGNEISKEDFEKVVKLDKHNVSDMWYIKLQDLTAVK